MGRQLPELDPAMAARIAATTTTRASDATDDVDAVSVDAITAIPIAPDATAPTIATSAGRQAIIDTEAGLLGGGVIDADRLGDVADVDPGALAGGSGGPGGTGLLPGFDLGTGLDGGSLGSIADRLTASLDGGGTGDGATMGRGMMMDGGDQIPLASLLDSRSLFDRGATQASGSHFVRTDTYIDETKNSFVRTTYDYDPATNSVTVTRKTGPTMGDADATSGTVETWHAGEDGGSRYEPASDDNGPLWSSGITAQDVTDFVNGLFGGSDSDVDSTGTDSGDTATSNGADAGYQTEEQAGTTRPRGWIDGDDLLSMLGRGGTAGVVSGSRGGDPDGSGDATSGRPGPMGGDTTVNPGPEGTYDGAVAERGALLGGSATAWVGQPKPVDGGTVVPRVIDAPAIGAAPETINPGSGDAQMSGGDAQASTAYDASAMAEGQHGDEPERGRDFGMGNAQDHGHGPHDAHGGPDGASDADADLGDGMP